VSIGFVLERLFVVLALFFFSGAVLPLLQNPGGEGVVIIQDDPISRYALVVIYSIVLAFLAFRWKETLETMQRAPLFWALTLLAVTSSLWSTDPQVTLRAGVWLIASGLFAIYFVSRFPVREQLRLLGTVLALVLLLSLWFALFVPSLGVDPGLHGGAWRGAFIHKNSLGRAMSIAVVVFILVGVRNPLIAPLAWVAAAAAGVLVVLSKSGTAIAVTASLALLVPLQLLLRTRRVPLFVVVAAFGIVLMSIGVFLASNWAASLALIGRDPSLSGRTLLWAAVARMIMEKPWLGYGTQAFWHGGHADYAAVWKVVGWAPPHAHNGFLDVMLDLGVIGTGLFLIGFGFAVWRALGVARYKKPAAEALWPLAYLAFFILSNLSESTILRQNSLFWILYGGTVSLLVGSTQTLRETEQSHDYVDAGPRELQPTRGD